MKLKKISLGPDWIDLSYGEPKVIANILYRNLNIFGNPLNMPNLLDLSKWEYPPAVGRPELISLLEKKHGSKVVIFNGAKQALAAALHVMRRHGHKVIQHNVPFYPPGVEFIGDEGFDFASSDNKADLYLLTSPNNPDGKNLSNVELMSYRHNASIIHDAAYYTEIYLPEDQVPIPIGDIQVFSISKMYGLSGLRLGYAVIHNEEYHQDMIDYVEHATAGVSVASQDILFRIETFFKNNPRQYKNFIQEARSSLIESRKELSQLDTSVLEVLPCDSNSMFAWCKIGQNLDYNAAKVNMLGGALFGQHGMMRLNIAHPTEVIAEAVRRLNDKKRS